MRLENFKHANGRKERAFTLLEVLIAVVIASMMIMLVLGIWRKQLQQTAFLSKKTKTLVELEEFVKDFVAAFWLTQPPVVIDASLLIRNPEERMGGWKGATVFVNKNGMVLRGSTVRLGTERETPLLQDVEYVFTMPTCEIVYKVDGRVRRKKRYKHWQVNYKLRGKFIDVTLTSERLEISFSYRIPVWFR